MSDIETSYPDNDFILFTADISQTASEEIYALFNSVIRQYDLPVFCVPRNHDTPRLLKQTVPNCPDESINITQFGQFSLVLLNSCVQGEHHGMVSQHCLKRLGDHLNNCEKQFNIIAIHHPQVPVNSTWLDEIALQNTTELLQFIKKHPDNALFLFVISTRNSIIRLIDCDCSPHHPPVNRLQKSLISLPTIRYSDNVR